MYIWAIQHDILVLIACVQKSLLKATAVKSCWAIDLFFVMSLTLLQYYVYARSKGCGETVSEPRLVICAFACVDPESFARGGPTLTTFFSFLMGKRIK